MATDQSVSGGLAQLDTAGFAIWLTGLPGAGKTTLAYALQEQLAAQGIHTLILDSDHLRSILTRQPTYSAAERDWFYGVLAQLAGWLTHNGINVLIAATAHQRRYRGAARRQIARFAEVFVCCSVATCQARDPKGLYAGARLGQAPALPGVGVGYEPPLHPEAVIDTEHYRPDEAARLLLAQLAEFLRLPG